VPTPSSDTYTPLDIDGLLLILDERLPGTDIKLFPDEMKVEADEDTRIIEKTVGKASRALDMAGRAACDCPA
jgi:hypothetical protein